MENFGFDGDVSPEELRWQAYLKVKMNNNLNDYVNKIFFLLINYYNKL